MEGKVNHLSYYNQKLLSQCQSVWSLYHSANVVRLICLLLPAWQGFQVFKVSPSILLILPHIIYHIRDHHGEPAKHGDEHGVVSSLFREVTKVSIIGSVEERPPSMFIQHRGLANYIVCCLMIGCHAPQNLLESAVTMPGVVGNSGPRLQIIEGIFMHALNPVVRQVQGLQGFCYSFECMLIDELNAVFRQVENSQLMEVLKNLIGDGCDLIGVQVEQNCFWREISGYFLEICIATGDI